MASAAAPKAASSGPDKKINLEGFGYQAVAHIGRGHSASAQVVCEMESGREFVAKCVSLASLNEHDQEFAKQEAFLLQSLQNPLIVAYHDSFLIEGLNVLVIIMEYCGGGDLRTVIKSKAASNDHFSEDQVMSWFVQIALALQYIHSHKILHRDLKTSNIFLSEGSSTVKLGDFGLSRVFERTSDAAVTMVGTPYYMSPEVCSNTPYNWKSDVWSLGCVLYEMCMLKHAFESSSLFGLVYKIVSGHYEPIPSVYSQDLNDLIGRLLTKSAESRPNISELLSIPYVKVHLQKEKCRSAGTGIPESLSSVAPVPTRGKRESSPTPPASLSASSLTYQTAAVQVSFTLDPLLVSLLLASRVRRRLVVQRLNWLSALGRLDDDGSGTLPLPVLKRALVALGLALSASEAEAFAESLVGETGEEIRVPLAKFEEKLVEASIDGRVLQLESWARQTLEPVSSKVAIILSAQDIQQTGSLSVANFRAALTELVPDASAEQLEALVQLAGKRESGDIDYMDFADAFGAPPPPPPLPDVCWPEGPCVPEAPTPDQDTQSSFDQATESSFFTCIGAPA